MLVGYYLLRKYRPNVTRPFRLPEFFKYIALAMAALYAFIWLYGGISYAPHRRHRDLLLPRLGRRAAYIPFYLYRTRVEDKRLAREPAEPDRSCRREPCRRSDAGDIAGRRAGGASHVDGPDPDEPGGARGPARLRGPRDPHRRDRPRRADRQALGRRPCTCFTIARVWGTSFGFPNPGLNPTKREWDQQRHNVEKAIGRLERKGVEADGRVVATRAGAQADRHARRGAWSATRS